MFVVLIQISCKKNETNLLENPSVKETTAPIDMELQATLEAQEDVKYQIIALSKKKDSLQNVLKSTKESMARVNDTKIDKGIEGVNLKLNELKGQKENFEEQAALQIKEIDLATKKIDLLNQEKVVYDAQKKALWDKGAPPKDFVTVDSLLAGINGKINEQNRKVKILNRNVADVEEQVVSINGQRNFLSTKIRENYNAQEILGEFAKDEETKINAQIAGIDTRISMLSGKVSSINSTVAGLNSEIAAKEATAQGDLLKETRQIKTKNRLWYAFIAIGFLIVVFYALFRIGKNKKNNKTKK